MSLILAIAAFVLEVIHWATTRDSSLAFYALMLATLAILLGGVALPALNWPRREA